MEEKKYLLIFQVRVSGDDGSSGAISREVQIECPSQDLADNIRREKARCEEIASTVAGNNGEAAVFVTLSQVIPLG